MEQEISYLYNKIKALNETLWGNKAQNPTIQKWLDNYGTEDEKNHSLYLLSKFMYFGESCIRNLCISMYRDLYRYPIINDIRKSLGGSLDEVIIEPRFNVMQQNTIFVSVGNPSESGAKLLYLFRQENDLSITLFSDTNNLVGENSYGKYLKNNNAECYIFIDDFCGTGHQVTSDKDIRNTIKQIRALKPTAKISYFMLLGTINGIEYIKSTHIFDKVEAVIELDESHKCFGDKTRLFDGKTKFKKEKAKNTCYKYGFQLMKSICKKNNVPEHDLDTASNKVALGYGDCQLLIGFHYNTPDNTLPIIWYNEDDVNWFPIFKRYNKIY